MKSRVSILKKYLKKIEQKLDSLPVITIGLLVFGVMAAGGIIIGINNPPHVYTCQTQTPWYSNPLEPGENRIITFTHQKLPSSIPMYVNNFPVANGQKISVIIDSENRTSLKLIRVNIHEKLGSEIFEQETPYMSNNNSNHQFEINNDALYSNYIGIILNPTNQTLHFNGSITIQGFNHDYMVVPIILLAFCLNYYIVTSVIRMVKSKKIERKGKISFNQSVIKNIEFLFDLFRQELGTVHFIIIPLLAWLITQPLVHNVVYHQGGQYPLNSILRICEQMLISPLNATLFFYAIFLVIETSEIVASKINSKEVNVILSLPFSRFLWTLTSLIFLLGLYGGYLTLSLVIKAILLSFQLRFFYPLPSILLMILLLIVTLGAWISTGLITSFKSKTKISAAFKALAIILVVSSVFYFFDVGILGLHSIAGSFWPRIENWYEVDIQLQNSFISTFPNLTSIIPSLFCTGIWFGVNIILLYKLSQDIEGY